MAGGLSARFRASSRMCRVGSPSKSLSCKSLSAAIPSAGSWIRAQISPFSACLTCPKFGIARAVSSGSLWTAAFLTSARTTSSVIRALCANRSPNWSRAAGSGIRAATASMAVKNCRRPSSLFRSWTVAARSSRVLEIGAGIFQQIEVGVLASFLYDAVGIFASGKHRHIHLETLGHQQLT